jgi:signal transduction histidine kinase/ligand-binding sensor domain-containing protein
MIARTTRIPSSLRFFRAILLPLLGFLLWGAARLPAQNTRWHAAQKSKLAPAAAQPLEDMAHMGWTRRDGAPSDVAALAQTKDGYLWIGSTFGLYRFDGTRFQSYPFTPVDPPLPASNIAVLAADRDGGLWIGFRLGGITYLHNGKRVDYDKHDGLVGQSTEQLLCREDGSVWGIADGVMIHFTGNGWETYSARHGLPSEGLYSMFFDRDNNLWTADKGHVYELKRGEDKFAEVKIPRGVVNQFAQLPDGTMWISDAWKNVRPLHDDKFRNAVRIPGVPVMLVDRQGSIWLANEFGGLTRIKSPDTTERRKEDFTTENGLTDGQTRAILEDTQGTIWVGTARGLDRFRHTPIVPFRGVKLEYYPALLADYKDGLWLHDMDKPLMRLRNGQLSFVDIGHGSSSLSQDSEGGVWLLDQITREFYRYPEAGGAPLKIKAPKEGLDVETWCLGKDLHGALIACFEGRGLWRYTGTWARVDAPGMPDESPLSLVKGVGGRVWLGYAHNQIVLEDAQGYHTYGAQQGLQLNSVFAFYDANHLTLAGGSDGLAFFDGQSFHSLHLRSAGLLRGISGIVKDRSGDLWLNAATGIIRLPADQWQKALNSPQYEMDFDLLNEQDGIVGTPAQSKPTPSAVMDERGVLWFATSGHLVSIDPAQAKRAVSTPNVLLQSVVMNDVVQPMSDDGSFEIGSRQLKKLEFGYIGIDMISPDRVVYQYMLEGQDKEWQNAGDRRQADYTNLPPGKYHFRVRAASGTGPWSELPSGPQLILNPPYYQSTWFYLLCFVSLVVLLWVIYRLRLRQLTEQMQQRLEERARERVRIARDLHDTLLQGVQGLVLRFHFATEQLPEAEPARAMLYAALDRADQVIREGREKVTELRAEASSPAELQRYLSKTAAALQMDGPGRISLLVKGEPMSLHAAVQDELCFIGREAMTNAVRHSGAKEIVVELAYEAQQLQLQCRDDGCGVSQEMVRASVRQGHWGIIGMRERASGLGCTFDFSSTVGGGTVVTVRVPAKKAYARTNSAPWWKLRFGFAGLGKTL